MEADGFEPPQPDGHLIYSQVKLTNAKYFRDMEWRKDKPCICQRMRAEQRNKKKIEWILRILSVAQPYAAPKTIRVGYRWIKLG